MTDTGLLREHNEDSLLLLPEYGIIAVADGMGGHRSGDVASQLAISTLQDFFSVVVGRDGKIAQVWSVIDKAAIEAQL